MLYQVRLSIQKLITIEESDQSQQWISRRPSGRRFYIFNELVGGLMAADLIIIKQHL